MCPCCATAVRANIKVAVPVITWNRFMVSPLVGMLSVSVTRTGLHQIAKIEAQAEGNRVQRKRRAADVPNFRGDIRGRHVIAPERKAIVFAEIRRAGSHRILVEDLLRISVPRESMGVFRQRPAVDSLRAPGRYVIQRSADAELVDYVEGGSSF